MVLFIRSQATNTKHYMLGNTYKIVFNSNNESVRWQDTGRWLWGGTDRILPIFSVSCVHIIINIATKASHAWTSDESIS